MGSTDGGHPAVESITGITSISMTAISQFLGNGARGVSSRATRQVHITVGGVGCIPGSTTQRVTHGDDQVVTILTTGVTSCFSIRVCHNVSDQIRRTKCVSILLGSNSDLARRHRLLRSVGRRNFSNLIFRPLADSARRITNRLAHSFPIMIISHSLPHSA